MAKNSKIAIYPGSFDPLTNGHLDIINRAALIFEDLVIAVAANSEKNILFTKDERIEIISEATSCIENVRVESFNGLLVDYAKKNNVFTIIRGLRTLSDFEYEFRMAIMNRSLDSSIETVFLMTDEKYGHISSSFVKEIYNLDGDVSSFVPNIALSYLNKLRHEKNNK
tara:strand:+ start:1091 stop:1594 length:504 start_codon:yes stop_codon:yes gene_type:complete